MTGLNEKSLHRVIPETRENNILMLRESNPVQQQAPQLDTFLSALYHHSLSLERKMDAANGYLLCSITLKGCSTLTGITNHLGPWMGRENHLYPFFRLIF